MTYDSIYWFVIGASFILTGIVGVGVMWKTGKLLLSFLLGSAVNILIIGVASWWWAHIFAGAAQQFARLFALFGFGIVFFNNEVLLFFAQLIMKRKSGNPVPAE